MPAPGYEDRTEAFSDGHSPSLDQQQTTMAQQQPRRFRPSGANQQLAPSAAGTGSSDKDMRRQFLGGQMLPTTNGIAGDESSGTFAAKQLFFPTKQPGS